MGREVANGSGRLLRQYYIAYSVSKKLSFCL